MKTKRYQFDDDVLDVLRNVEFKAVGAETHGTIVSVLERGLYVRVNKALVALGGKWNRSAKAHIFNGDPRDEILDLLDADGKLEQDDYEMFDTPLVIAEQMVDLLELLYFDSVLEPSAGNGAIANALHRRRHIADINVNELNPQRFNALVLAGFTTVLDHPCDFLSLDHDFNDNYDKVIQNPPFSKDIEHIYKAYDVLYDDGTLVSVVSEGPFFRSTKRDVAFREWLIAHDAETFDLPAGAFHDSGTDVKARIIRVRKKS